LQRWQVTAKLTTSMRRENACPRERAFGADRPNARMGIWTADDRHEQDCGTPSGRAEVVNVLATRHDEPLVFTARLASRWDVMPGHITSDPLSSAPSLRTE
jgi:hypothetical protein